MSAITATNLDRSSVGRLWNGQTRSLVVVFAALLSLQGSDSVDPAKIVFLAVVGVSTGAALLRVWRERDRAEVRGRIPILAVAGIVALLCIISIIPATLGHTPTIAWVRDVATYALLAVALVLAVDFSLDAPADQIGAWLLVAGGLSTVSFTIVWLERRHLAVLPFDRLVFPSFLFAAGIAAYCVARAATERRRSWVPWAVASGVVLALLLVTETRSSLVVLAAPVGAAVFLGRTSVRRVALIAAIQLVVGIGAVLLTSPLIHPLPASSVGTTPPIASPGAVGVGGPPPVPGPVDRYSTIGDLAADPVADPSFQERLRQTDAVWLVFVDHPVLGAGPGNLVTWKSVAHDVVFSAYTLDSPVVFLEKFGIVGLALLGVVVALLGRVLLDARRRRLADAVPAAAFVAICLAWLPFGFPVEDKGSSLAILFLLAILATGLSGIAATARRE